MASPTKVTWNRRNHRDAKNLKKRQLKMRREQKVTEDKLSKLLAK
jgi:hypothetical protein